MKFPFFALLTLIVCSWTGLGEILEEGGGISFGEGYAFSLKAPKGWVLDNQSAVDQGLHTVFYPKDLTWATAPVVAYARARARDEKIKTAEDVAKDVVADFHANGSPDYVAKLEKTITTTSGKQADIYYFSGDQWGNYEAVAYITEEKTVNFIVYTARTKETFVEALPAFEELVKSYLYVGEKVPDLIEEKP